MQAKPELDITPVLNTQVTLTMLLLPVIMVDSHRCHHDRITRWVIMVRVRAGRIIRLWAHRRYMFRSIRMWDKKWKKFREKEMGLSVLQEIMNLLCHRFMVCFYGVNGYGYCEFMLVLTVCYLLHVWCIVHIRDRNDAMFLTAWNANSEENETSGGFSIERWKS